MKNLLISLAIIALSVDTAFGIVCYECLNDDDGALGPCDEEGVTQKEVTCQGHVIGCVEAKITHHMGNNSNVKYVSRQCLDRKRPKGDFNVPFLPEPIAADQDRANGELDVSGCIHYHDPRLFTDICVCDTGKCNSNCPCGAAGITALAGLTLLAAFFNKVLA